MWSVIALRVMALASNLIGFESLWLSAYHFFPSSFLTKGMGRAWGRGGDGVTRARLRANKVRKVGDWARGRVRRAFTLSLSFSLSLREAESKRVEGREAEPKRVESREAKPKRTERQSQRG